MALVSVAMGADAAATSLARDVPAARGVDAAGISAFLDAVAADGLELHGLMVYRAGAVVVEGTGSPTRRIARTCCIRR
jgi:hypothetical protein